ncbi:hypothetical protein CHINAEXTREME_00440 [Halobiforma lacisalsi AJ5]|uniref:Uncharacterized protein n=2 Tax=Natronobacterium lacisalsi TaxID=229731 RepID=A0A1P8LKK4_NATLA|nr:hypothetical protein CHINAEXTREME_00440 [Halobiforma lacisalsi AJ5]
MRSLTDCQFSVGFDNDPGEPVTLVFQAPTAMFPDNATPTAALGMLLTDHGVPVAKRETDDSYEHLFESTEAVSWDFTIRHEMTSYFSN